MDRIQCATGIEIEMAEATPAGVDDAIAILVEAAEWQTARGLKQWFPALFTDYLRGLIERQAECGELFLARTNGLPIGTLGLQWSDEEVWGPDDQAAGYVHRLAIRPDWMGKGIGRTMLDWAGDRCVRRGRSLLRLDTMSSNLELRAYYERLGFEYRGINAGPVWKPARYERPAANRHSQGDGLAPARRPPVSEEGRP